jgi:hypothetical protein
MFMLVGNAYSQFAFGLLGNYTTSLGFDRNWNFDTDRLKINAKNANGFAVGIFLRGGKRFFVQPEITYNFMVNQLNYDDNGDTQTVNIRLNTINLPVLFGGKIVNGDFFKFRVMFGPRFRFDLGSKNDFQTKTDSVVTVSPRTWQLGLEAGLGFDLGIVTVDFRYNLMQDIFNYTYSKEGVTLNKSPVNSFSVGLGVKLVGKKN